MRATAHLRRYLLAGLLLGMLELLLVLATGRDLFLSALELERYALLALTALPAACAAIGLLAQGVLALLGRGVEQGGSTHARRTGWLVFVLCSPLFAWVLWLLSSGRRVRELPGRAALVALLAAGCAAVLASIAARLTRPRSRHPRSLPLALLALATVALTLDMHVLRRLYPAFHSSLAVAALGAVLCGTVLLDGPAHSPERRAWPWWVLSAGLVAFAWLNLWSLSSAPNARFAIVQTAPLSGKALQVFRPRNAPLPVARPRRPASAVAQPADRAGIDLRRKDVLLITIDALRADRLVAYGGHGLTPALDRLAAESVVFLRAYTPTPHTSYALSSLMTGKFMQPLLSLAETKDEHATLAALLRRHGYRTAAFYPPAIFFVDGERFDWLRRGQLGFEYVKAMYAPAADRVPQLEQYLREVEPGHPLFVWVHLFEPHEPYEPLPQFARGDTPLERYEGEVAAADASVGMLVAAFRKARPSATVIVSADHGEEFGDHGGHHHGTTLFDEQVRVPLLWSSPGQTSPAMVRAPVEIIDITTTLLAALGIPRDARMRGDDLGPLLAGATEPASMRAFATIAGARMLTDGRLKLICGEDGCQLFDLVRDPAERRDVSREMAAEAATLHADLDELVASLPRIEALAMLGGGAWPPALARARLGDRSALTELTPLLSATRADVRAAAARCEGELDGKQARNVLSRMRLEDADTEVRAEAAIAALRLGETEAHDQVAKLVVGAAPKAEPAGRAALALAGQGDRVGQPVLLAMANDATLDEPLRVAAVRALAAVGDDLASEGILPLLEQVRLRPEVAAALGRIGDRRATPALLHALSAERYPASRTAEARALLALGARREALASTRRFLGTETSMPDGVGLLLESGALAMPSGAGADLRTARPVRRGEWQCEARGCRPLSGASIALPSRGAPSGPARVVLRVVADAASSAVHVGDEARDLDVGANEVSFAVPRARSLVLATRADEGVWLQAIASVPVQADVPAPPPEPWSEQQGGDRAGSDSRAP